MKLLVILEYILDSTQKQIIIIKRMRKTTSKRVEREEDRLAIG